MAYVEGIINQSMSGVIVLDRFGNPGAAHTTPKMAVGWVNGDGKICSAVKVELAHRLYAE